MSENIEENLNENIETTNAQEQEAKDAKPDGQPKTAEEADKTDEAAKTEGAEGDGEGQRDSAAEAAARRFDQFVFDDEVKKKRKKKAKKPNIPKPSRKELVAIVEDLNRKVAELRRRLKPFTDKLPELRHEVVEVQAQRLESRKILQQKAAVLENDVQQISEEIETCDKQIIQDEIEFKDEYKKLLHHYNVTKARLIEQNAFLDAQLVALSEWSYARELNLQRLDEIKWEVIEQDKKTMAALNNIAREVGVYMDITEAHAKEFVSTIFASVLQARDLASKQYMNRMWRENEHLKAEWRRLNIELVDMVKKSKASEDKLRRIKLDHEIASEALESIENGITLQQSIIEQLESQYELLKGNFMRERTYGRMCEWLTKHGDLREERYQKIIEIEENYSRKLGILTEVEKKLNQSLKQYSAVQEEFEAVKVILVSCLEALFQAVDEFNSGRLLTSDELVETRVKRQVTMTSLLAFMLSYEDLQESIFKGSDVLYELGKLGLIAPLKSSAVQVTIFKPLSILSSQSSRDSICRYLKMKLPEDQESKYRLKLVKMPEAYSKYIFSPEILSPASSSSLSISTNSPKPDRDFEDFDFLSVRRLVPRSPPSTDRQPCVSMKKASSISSLGYYLLLEPKDLILQKSLRRKPAPRCKKQKCKCRQN